MKRLIGFSFFILALFLHSFREADAMIHHLDLKSDTRLLVRLTSFGFIRDGNLTVSISNLVAPKSPTAEVALTLDRSTHSQQSDILPSWDERQPRCLLDTLKNDSRNQVVIFNINFSEKRLTINRRGSLMKNLSIGATPADFIIRQTTPAAPGTTEKTVLFQGTMHQPRVKRSVPSFFSKISDSSLFLSRRKRENSPSASGPSPKPTDQPSPQSSVTPKPVASRPTVPTETLLKNGTTTAAKQDVSKILTTVKPVEVFNGTVDWIELISFNSSGVIMYNISFTVRIVDDNQEGFYNLAFHNCNGGPRNLSIWMIEMNGKHYLSVGEWPLPIMYFVFFIVCVILAAFWHWLLYVSQEGVCKIHYLMLALMYIKSVSLLFHGINLQFMQTKGQKEEAFAILFYIVYLLKGIVMFLTIVLIGAGWTFVRHILSDRDKKIFVIVIPLQIIDNIKSKLFNSFNPNYALERRTHSVNLLILVNVATIFVEESEQGIEGYTIMKELMIFLDLICCGAILFPIVGSIRHLQQASQTDGKAAVNLEKLKIFRHFYILVVCFIYFTRIIVLLVGITVPFRYVWLDMFFVELATIGFFVLTGYKFRPASDNPYLKVSTSDDEEDDAESLTRNGALESVTRVNFKQPRGGARSGRTDVEEGDSEDEMENGGVGIDMGRGGKRSDEIPLIKQREASHEYD